MLVVTRREGTAVVLGGFVVVRILGVEGGKVRVGIDAPRDVPIFRGEIAPAAMLTARQREDEMRREGSRRFVQQVA